MYALNDIQREEHELMQSNEYQLQRSVFIGLFIYTKLAQNTASLFLLRRGSLVASSTSIEWNLEFCLFFVWGRVGRLVVLSSSSSLVFGLWSLVFGLWSLVFVFGLCLAFCARFSFFGRVR